MKIRETHLSTITLAEAISVVNRHAKTAPNPKFLYQLKTEALKKMIKEKKAIKIGLHFSNNPKRCQQTSDVLIACEEFYFHLPPSKDDFKNLPHLGHRTNHRNPKVMMSIKTAKQMLITYTGLKESTTFETTRYAYKLPVFKRYGER